MGKKEESNASKDYEKVSSPLSEEENFSFYKAKLPAEYNRMICLCRAYRSISQAVRWMKTFDGAAQFKRPLELKLKCVQRAAERKKVQQCVRFLDDTLSISGCQMHRWPPWCGQQVW